MSRRLLAVAPVDHPGGAETTLLRPLRGNGPVIGFIGRLEPRKGPLDLVNAASAIRAGAPEGRVVIGGDEPYGLAPEVVKDGVNGRLMARFMTS